MLTIDPSVHPWKFFRAGGFDQVNLQSAADLQHLKELDQKLWVALGCPAQGLEFDTQTLQWIDSDKDGRIRAPEIIAAVQWACQSLKKPEILFAGASTLPLDAINDATPEGRQLRSSAHQILANLGKGNSRDISIEDTTDTARIFAETSFNGDGIVTPDFTEDPLCKGIIANSIDCLGSDMDRSGKPGISQVRLDLFFAEAQAYSDWQKVSETDPAILLLKESTATAAAAFLLVKVKVEDYFTRCQLAAFDPRSSNALNREEKDYLALTDKDLSAASVEIAKLPLSRIEADRPLPLLESVNPAWVANMRLFHALVVKPLLGDIPSITREDWTTLKARFSPYEIWMAGKAGARVEKLGLPRIREILSGKGREMITTLIAQDKALEAEANAIAAVDRLLHYNRDLCKLLRNFVSFADFYERKDKAIFQTGVLFLDTRSCELCIRVTDMARHSTMASLSRTYLAYCDCVRTATKEKMTIAAAFTDGDSDDLFVGRNGIFYDRKGQDWDATIVKIVENPISIRQAFWAPYKRLMRFIEEQVAKRAAAADTAAVDNLIGVTGTAAKPAPPGKAPEVKPKFDVGVVAALGVAVGGITAALGALLQAFFGLGIWMPLGVIAIVMLVSGPSMIIAWLKLRQRNLGPILDANGWAVNAKAKINIPFGGSLTSVATLPPGAQWNPFDPYAENKAGRKWFIAVAGLLLALWSLWYFGAAEALAPHVFPNSPYLERIEKAEQERLDKLKKATTPPAPSASAATPGTTNAPPATPAAK